MAPGEPGGAMSGTLHIKEKSKSPVKQSLISSRCKKNVNSLDPQWQPQISTEYDGFTFLNKIGLGAVMTGKLLLVFQYVFEIDDSINIMHDETFDH